MAGGPPPLFDPPARAEIEIGATDQGWDCGQGYREMMRGMDTMRQPKDVASGACLILAAFGAACVAAYVYEAEWREAAVLAAVALPAAVVFGLMGQRTRRATVILVRGLIVLSLICAALAILFPDNRAREAAHPPRQRTA